VRRLLQGVAVCVLASLVGLFVWQLAHRHDGSDFVAAVDRGSDPPAPAFTLPYLRSDTGELSLVSLRGEPAVLNFWASWCDPCRQEAGSLDELASKWTSRGVRFVGVDAQDAPDSALAFAQQNGVSYTLVHDSGSEVKDRYGVTGFPETFVLDRRGRAVAHFDGPIVDNVVPQFEAALRRAGARA
jgi:cytochrome c biogenesis protein CcmG/thiol:disulfide interchange protein DsbE